MAKQVRNFTRRSLIRALALAVPALAFAAFDASAHEASSGDLVLSHPWAEPGAKGGNTRMYVVIQNEEQFKVSLSGVSSPLAERIELKFRSPDGAQMGLSSRVIAAEETLNVASSHMWFELTGLKADLRPGEVFRVTFYFGDRGAIPADVIVGHRSDPPEPAE